MKIRINKWFGASLSNRVPAHASRELVCEVKLAREKAWRDAFFGQRCYVLNPGHSLGARWLSRANSEPPV